MSAKKYARIHILLKEAGLSRVQYEAMLSAYGVTSSKELSDEQTRDLIQSLTRLQPEVNDKGRHGWGANKYEHLGIRRGMASPREMRMIEAMWRDVARDKSDEALGNFLARQTASDNQLGIKSVIWLRREHVKPVLVALKMMKKSKPAEAAENA